MDWFRRFLGLQPTDNEEATESAVQPAKPIATDAPTQPNPIGKKENLAPSMETLPKRPRDLPPSELDTDEADMIAADGRTRKLPPLETVQPEVGHQLVYGQLSDVGQMRDNNQDAVLSFVSSASLSQAAPNFGLFVVADGMGGHENGERASAIATRVIAKHVIDEIFIPSLSGEIGSSADRPTITEVLREAVQQANHVVSEQVPDGGTTVTTAAIIGHAAYLAHVGDSRAYLITDEFIEQITRDHSLVQRLIELDQLTPEDAVEHPQRNVLYRALGQNDHLDVDPVFRQLPPGAFLLICSDGLWNLVKREEIQQIVLEERDTPQQACQRLVEMANDRGGTDNITVIIVRVPN
ncbi:MAG: hypothetical protein CUN55_09710 [Phototrophicales bacterium]|nr:MAG: hypothetical protein CUN55_09710 [Phototrophicales bacterium]